MTMDRETTMRASASEPRVMADAFIQASAGPIKNIEQARAESRDFWLPVLVCLGALGLALVAGAMAAAARELTVAPLLLWPGLLLIYTPVAFRMALPDVPRHERIALAVWLGLALYLVKVLRAPFGFILHDEFPHFATVNDILRTGALFHVNSLQEISAFFPGAEIVTAGLVLVSGLPIETAGLIVIGAARLIAALAIYLLYEEISGSPRVAGVGSMLAIAYPNYTFFSGQFSYESVALPLAMLVLFVGTMSRRREIPRRVLIGLALVLVLAVVATHHVTSYFMVTALIGLAVLSQFGGQLVSVGERIIGRAPARLSRLLLARAPAQPEARTTDAVVWRVLAAAGLTSAVVWLLVFGQQVFSYLGPHLRRATQGFMAILTRTGSVRTPFSSGAQTTAPPAWEQLISFAAVLFVAAVLPFGLLQVWRHYRQHAVALLFGITALIYPITPVLRLARGGAEIANRSWNFLFVGLGFILALAVVELWLARPRAVPRAGAFALYATVLFIGALMVGMPPFARLPGPFMVGGDTRGLQAESYAVAYWARDTLGPDHRFIGDYTSKWLLGSHGEQYIVDGLSWVYISPKLVAPDELADIVKRNAQYIVVDWRMTEDTPRLGHYFEPGEPKTPHLEPLNPDRLLKFEREPCLTRVYDSGHIIVYAVGPTCAAEQKGSD